MPVYKLLDSDSNEIIQKNDVPKVFMALDKNRNGLLERVEFKNPSEKVFPQMCASLSRLDRAGWLMKTQRTEYSRQSLFQVLDVDYNDVLDESELKRLYIDMDTNKNK